MSDDEPERPARPVTSMSLRAEKLRVTMARAAGAKLESDPGLSALPKPRDPELVNRFAIAGFVIGLAALFLDAFFVPSVVALVFCFLGLQRARVLVGRGKEPFGRRRALWGIGFALFGAAGIAYSLWIRPLF
ncbi:hypothetical protein GCM10025867_26490 [Frondihabitans sucicola]|uniref:DUF4190 domain-containing protein n=1 Tax=Frondihabitans sucicola TaxID=1268041 RepID=A0ABM8GPN7_9MICO|nr:hypothetical protein [Frondihabitans sucicola]BDZ50408.1 hypothetical protein GCM10025867_26490 [Frondihabitans sucicola]